MTFSTIKGKQYLKKSLLSDVFRGNTIKSCHSFYITEIPVVWQTNKESNVVSPLVAIIAKLVLSGT